MKILILGGYGVFGGRLAQLLKDEPGITMMIAGRNLQKAKQFCAKFQGAAQLEPLHLDRKDVPQKLSQFAPDLLVDASGPFQEYGDATYDVIEACIAHRINYLDFADGADFVFGVSRFDESAKEAGIYVLAGVSSFPVLTAAVLREIAKKIDIESVTGGIAPSPYAGIGLNVMRAVVGYAGSAVKLTRNGKQAEGIGLAESRRYTIAVPGKLPLRNIHFSLVDVPDLQVLPPLHPQLRDIWMGAGPVPEILHRILNLLAKARHKLHLPSLVPLAPFFYRILNLMKFGEHRGGMFIHARGKRGGIEQDVSWHLLAEGDDGPFIPSMAIEGIVRKAIEGSFPAAGARPATDALELRDYEQLFARRTIYTGMREEVGKAQLYPSVLGSAFCDLPSKVRQLHNSGESSRWSGIATVKRGKSPFAHIIAAIMGFPKAAENTPVVVDFKCDEKGELWTRKFGDQSFSSFQKRGTARATHLITERFGLASVDLAAVIEDDRLLLIPRRFSVLGIPMPGFLLPKGTSYETEKDGKFVFNVEVSLPIIGPVVTYQGQLDQE